MSATSNTASGSRSPSPSTPEASESPELVTIHSELDLPSSWYPVSTNSSKDVLPWASDPSVYTATHKAEEEQMLCLDELIERHAYDDSPSSEFNSAMSYSSPPPYPLSSESPPSHSRSVFSELPASNVLVPSRREVMSLTKPIPPPASLLRKSDPSTITQRVVHPPKESCFNLPIMFPSIPEGGTKSRVETQVRVTVDLAASSSTSDPYKYDRIGSWKWLKLPRGTATKKRTRKQGKIDPDPEDILHLSASVTCASPPHNPVLSCSSCQTREAKRVAKKLAARVRPARSDSDSEIDASQPYKRKHHEDTTSIIQFNCAEILDFSTGSVVLPLRITCYCRHHREKIGFNVHFALTDHTGRIVGSGVSRPIMITDDHKTSAHKVPELIGSFSLDRPDWPLVGGILADRPPAVESGAPSKRKKDGFSAGLGKKRLKPYDALAKPNRVSREGSVSSVPSPSTSYSPLPTSRAPTPYSALQRLGKPEAPGFPALPTYDGMRSPETSSPDSLPTPLDPGSDINMPELSSARSDVVTDRPSPTSDLPLPSNMLMTTLPHTMPFMFYNRSGSTLNVQPPTIHRLIPNTGPTHGGIEVTILGANFYPTIQLNCIFGDVAASSTQRWSDNTLVCILPPRSMPGVVSVWFEGFPKVDDQTKSFPSLFTYSDESDRALMELALQVVGLKMTGKIEDAKNVAMRIVGNAGGDGSNSGDQIHNAGMMQLATSPAMRDLRPHLFLRADENDDFESSLIKFLSVMDTPMGDSAPLFMTVPDAISHPSPSGQTLLHLASLLGLSSLTRWLVQHGADLDARDRNGFTPLHFSALSQSKACAWILLEAGADIEVVNALGKTPEEISTIGFFANIIAGQRAVDLSHYSSEDDEGELGDAEDDDIPIPRVRSQHISRRSSQLMASQSGRATPRRSVDPSRAPTPPPLDSKSDEPAEHKGDVDVADAKRAASFMEKMIQRALGQIPAIPATQGIIPNIPQLPIPHLPDLKAVQWANLPQIPMVFPIFVPMMPNWPSFLGGEHDAGNAGEPRDDVDTPHMGSVALRAAQEWRATWEKWVALAVATTARQQTEDLPPPVYTPRAGEEESSPNPCEIVTIDELQMPVASTSSRPHPDIRPVGYDSTPIPDQVVESFGYQPTAKQTHKMQKKHDRMLLLFWLPILLFIFRKNKKHELPFRGLPSTSDNLIFLLCEMKRQAEKQLIKGDDEVEVDDGSPSQGFKKADEAVLAARVIRSLPKRAGARAPQEIQSNIATTAKNYPSAISSTTSSAVSDSFKLESTTSSVASTTSASTVPPFLGFAFNKPTAAGTPEKDFFMPSASSSSSTPTQSTKSSFSFTSNPSLPITSPSATSTSKAFAASLSHSTNPSNSTPTTSPASSTSQSLASGGPSHSVALKYFTDLRGLNISILSAISKAVEEDPFFDIINLLEQYRSFRLKIQKNFERAITESDTPSQPINTASPQADKAAMPLPPPSFSGFDALKSAPSSASSTTETKPVSFNFGSSDTNKPFTLPKDSRSSTTPSGSSPFSLAHPSVTNSPGVSPLSFTVGASSKPSTSQNANPFGSFGTKPSSGFSFGVISQPSNPIFKTDSGAGSSPFTFGVTSSDKFDSPSPSNIFGSKDSSISLSPFGKATTKSSIHFEFGNSSSPADPEAAKPEVESNQLSAGDGLPDDRSSERATPAAEAEGGADAPPALLSSNPHDEDGEGEENEETVHSIRSKVLRFDNNKWVSHGVGLLKVKKDKDSEARRLLMRNSSTGNVILNFRLYSGLKLTQDIDQPNTLKFIGHESGVSQPYSVKVKTKENAEELKSILEKEITFVRAKEES